MKDLEIKKLLEMSLEERDVTIFNYLRLIDCGEHIEKLTQNNVTLSYLSWAWALDTIQQILPISYKIKYFDDENGLKKPYIKDNETGYMVSTEITILGITKEMWLPVLDTRNKPMKNAPYKVQTKNSEFMVAQASMFEINKSLMRCLVKNLALFGLGAYIYAGEDLPERPIEYITQEQLNEMKALNVKVEGVLKTYNITNIEMLTKNDAEFVISSKKKFLEKEKAKEQKDNA